MIADSDSVHLCHGMSYAISGMNKGYTHSGYNNEVPLIPHGVSVAVTAPMVFKFTAASNPERHLKAAALFGADVTNAKPEMAGEILENAIKEFMGKLDTQPKGIEDLGYNSNDIPELVTATLPQARVLALAPEMIARQDLEYLFDRSLRW